MSRTEYNCNPSGNPRGSAISQGALSHNAAHAADAEAVFKKVLLETSCINSIPQFGVRLSPDRFRVRVPGRNRVFEIGVIGQMAADCRMVSKDLVLYGWLAASNRVEEICLMRRHIAVTDGRSKSLRLVHLVFEGSWLRMFYCPLRQILLAQPLRPAFRRICFRLRGYILRREGEGLPNDFHGAFGAVEPDRLTTGVVQIAAQHHAEFREVIKGLDHIREVASIFPAKQSAARLCPLRGLIRARDKENSREQVNEQVAGQTFAVVGVAAPAEKACRVERPFGRAYQECIPVDGLLARIGRNSIHPCAAG